ncbi:hypothetical protein SNS2_2015 [Streptomyces netropsis]|uniref:Anti-sigma regulatory factor (Ser/Thr protein kinase) n=1 Tax=Streptomyces syringium TaxID=76729 RepID=A0ABS4Y661_9ACTN|nr:ATP-binding protein [Streptomyces syringium]MBP2404257.1 anti-sigma regulatory factor (Ser/Thr protein kinase) [Streptomyces syringium]SPE53549.1 hypothetical protein SNS2_2015 [Streptomyces netropsis]
MAVPPTARTVTPKDTEWLLPRTPRSVGHSRVLLREQSRSWGIPDETTWTAVLLLSELMTNACVHARVPPGRVIGTRCVLLADRLRVEVSDASRDLPRLKLASRDDEAGRGLVLVASLADAWDVHPRAYGIGKTVWFELGVLLGKVSDAN